MRLFLTVSEEVNVNIFDFKSYQDYLGVMLPAKGHSRGIRSRLAAQLDCRVSHLTQVIQGKSHISLEMAEKIASFLSLGELESHFFILLVSKERSGSNKLKSYYDNQLEQVLENRKHVKNKLKLTDSLTDAQMQEYYSSWHYSAVHILVSLPEVKDIKDICNNLGLDLSRVKQVVDFLLQAKIIKSEMDRLQTVGRRLHIDSKSKHTPMYHMSWRAKAMEVIATNNSNNLHFSSVYSLAKEDIDRIRDVLLNSLNRSEEIVKGSAQNTLVSLNIDFMQLTN
jgi:uncharacterized protein (TIGR02147 family)